MIRRSSCAALAIAIFFVPLRCVADDTPNANDIRAHVLAAEGTPLVDYRETVDETAFGLQIRSVIAHAGKDFRETVQEGPVRTAAGAFGGQAWRQNENGETILVSADPGLAAGEVYGTTVTRIASPVTGYLVSRVNAAGFGTKRYVDSTTWHVVREDAIRASGTLVTTYDDFRTVAGHTFAFHSKTTDGRAEDDRDLRVASIDVGPVAASEVAIPASTRTLVEFPPGKHSVSLPVHDERDKFVIRVMVGTRGLDFEIDSGASGIVLEEGVAKQLGLTEVAHELNNANAGRYRSTSVVIPLMTVGDLKLHDVFVQTVPSIGDRGPLNEYRVVGLLGFDFIDAVALELDYIEGTAMAYDPQTFKPPSAPHSFALDLRLGGGVPFTTVKVNGAVGERFFLDTGAYGALLVFDRFVRRNPRALVDEGGGDGRNVNLRGIGGAIPIKPYQIKLVEIGPVRYTDFLAYVVSRGQYENGSDGLIGPSLMRVFDITFDYAHEKAYFVSKDDGDSSPAPSASP